MFNRVSGNMRVWEDTGRLRLFLGYLRLSGSTQDERIEGFSGGTLKQIAEFMKRSVITATPS